MPFLQLLAEFDDRGGWCGDGIRSCAHWLSWRAGMSVRTGAERLRVAHALRNLPRITEAFATGKLSYSKVRAITRITGTDTVFRAARTPGICTPTMSSTGCTVAGPMSTTWS